MRLKKYKTVCNAMQCNCGGSFTILNRQSTTLRQYDVCAMTHLRPVTKYISPADR